VVKVEEFRSACCGFESHWVDGFFEIEKVSKKIFNSKYIENVNLCLPCRTSGSAGKAILNLHFVLFKNVVRIEIGAFFFMLKFLLIYFQVEHPAEIFSNSENIASSWKKRLIF
jgi:hypothetical protein